MKKALTVLIIILVFPTSVMASISDYLIETNIGSFIASKNPSEGVGRGILAGADHFGLDHDDFTFRISYFNLQADFGLRIQVTQHAGSDSDQWLLHEVEDAFRGNPEQDNFKGVLREINGNRIFTYLPLNNLQHRRYNGEN